MTLEFRGQDIVLLDLPLTFTLPESFPVRWCAELKAFALPKRHASVPALIRLLRERGLLLEEPEELARARRGPNVRFRPAMTARA